MLERDRSQAVELAVQGDADALQRLLIHYHEALRTVVARRMPAVLRRRLDPEDILQMAYTAAFQSIRDCRFDGPGGFYKWLEQIALTRLAACGRDMKRLRRDVRREQGAGAGRLPGSATSYHDLAAQLAAGSTTPSRHLAQRETAAAVISSMARLTEDQRVVIRLRLLEGRTAAEVAAQIEKTEAAVHMLTHRGLKALQTHLGSMSRFLSR